MDTAPGLRERKKAATRRALHEAAVRLAADHGPDRITVEGIADAAGVSRRTFSNYFANKDEALLYADHLRMRLLLDLVHERPTTEAPWTALTTAALELHHRIGDQDPRWVAQSRLVRTHPSLLTQQAATYAALERELTAEVTARLPHPSALRARVITASFLAALRLAVQVWLDEPPGTRLADLVRQALDHAGSSFDS